MDHVSAAREEVCIPRNTDKQILLSVVIITKNESLHIIPCLESVRFADEWIVVDSGSADDTLELAKQWGASVFSYPDWQGFGIQKNRALAHARGEWVFSIDADERVTPELQCEIQAIIHAPAESDLSEGYTVPRLSYYCGHPMRHGGWWPDRVLRLFRREAGRFSDRKVHESIVLKGRGGTLASPLQHFTHPSLEAVIQKMNAYSTAGAAVMEDKGRSVSFGQAVFHALWAFLKMYLFRAGFLDGAYGFMAAISHAEGTYYRYVKRWLMQQGIRTKGIQN
jgi:glycosyltransferase involved in cell wall biosynthesis